MRVFELMAALAKEPADKPVLVDCDNDKQFFCLSHAESNEDVVILQPGYIVELEDME